MPAPDRSAGRLGSPANGRPRPRGQPGVSVVVNTHRRDPAFAWFADSLAAQTDPGDELEVIFVDGLVDEQRRDELARIVDGRFAFRHVAPKPNPWNGPHRVTRGAQHSAMSSARNTGIVYASNAYVVFVDDACVLTENWWRTVQQAARDGLVVAGAYRKDWGMIVRDGVLIESRPDASGIDCRWERGDDDQSVPIGGGELFGAGTGAPRELLVELNGFDELCDPVGGEDYHLGLRIEWSGVAIHYCRAMLVVESEELHRQPPVVTRHGKSTDSATYMRRLREFGVRERSTTGPCDISHLILDVLYGTQSLTTLGNHYSLATMTEADLQDTIERFPRRHWFDQQPLAEF